jgi:hypothetical protein
MLCNGEIFLATQGPLEMLVSPPLELVPSNRSLAFFTSFLESSTSSRRDCRFGGFLALTDPFLAMEIN